ncbi:MAG: GNAT family N-acetyltransferase [Candidatus Hermodarchaeota archaeon]
MEQTLLKNGQTAIIREANESDAIEIKNIVNSVASEKKYVVLERSREDWDEAIREIKNRESLIIVAQVNGKTVGMAHLVRGKFKKNRHIGFLGILILKKFRIIGIGTAMMNYIMEWTKKSEDLEKISLTVFATNIPAINLYHKFRFINEGICKKQYKIEGDYIDEIIMGKFLTLPG